MVIQGFRLNAGLDHSIYSDLLCHKIKTTLTDSPIIPARPSEGPLGAEFRGDAIYKRIVDLLTYSKEQPLYNYQLNFARTCIVPSLPLIYRDDSFEENQDKILASHGVKNFYTELLYIAARRMGKSLTCARIAVSYALSIPGKHRRPFRVGIFATSQDSADRDIEECQIATGHMDPVIMKEFNIRVTASRIIFTNKKNPSDIRVIKAYCGRGQVCSNDLTRVHIVAIVGSIDIHHRFFLSPLIDPSALLSSLVIARPRHSPACSISVSTGSLTLFLHRCTREMTRTNTEFCTCHLALVLLGVHVTIKRGRRRKPNKKKVFIEGQFALLLIINVIAIVRVAFFIISGDLFHACHHTYCM